MIDGSSEYTTLTPNLGPIFVLNFDFVATGLWAQLSQTPPFHSSFLTFAIGNAV